METSSCNFTDSQKESCAVTAMRDAVISLSARECIPYEGSIAPFYKIPCL